MVGRPATAGRPFAAGDDAPRVGLGWDLHRLEAGRPFRLGGVTIPSEVGPVGHSDGDALLHALIDAMLGAAGLGDIGERFPDTDPQWKDVASDVFLRKTKEDLRSWSVVNADLTVLAEEPKLGPYREKIRARVAELLGVSMTRINLKAKTMEGLGPIGAREAIAVLAAVQMEEAPAK